MERDTKDQDLYSLFLSVKWLREMISDGKSS